MATHVIRKVVDKGVGFSAVDLNDVRHVFAAAVPRRGPTLRQQANDALRTIEAVIQEEGTRGSIVHQAVFLADVTRSTSAGRSSATSTATNCPPPATFPSRPAREICWRSRPSAWDAARAKSRSSAQRATRRSPGTTASPGSTVRSCAPGPNCRRLPDADRAWNRSAGCWPASASASTR